MKQEVKFHAAFDKRDSDLSKNYGVHGVTLYFFLQGDLGVVQFVLHTNWQLPHVTKEQDAKSHDSHFRHLLCHPLPADLGYHSPKPMYKEHQPMEKQCHLLKGPCYYDGSGLNAERVYKRLLHEGDDGVWAELREEYTARFGELK